MLEGKLIIIPALGPQPVRPLFECPSEGIIMSLPSIMTDFVPCDRLLQEAYCLNWKINCDDHSSLLANHILVNILRNRQ